MPKKPRKQTWEDVVAAKVPSLAEALNARPKKPSKVLPPVIDAWDLAPELRLPQLQPGRVLDLELPAPFAATHTRLGRDKAGNVRGFLDPRYANWRQRAREAVLAGMMAARVGPPAAHQPVRVDILFLSARTQERPTWVPKDLWDTGEPLWRPVRPDVENFTESVHDALQGWIEPTRSGQRVRHHAALEDDGAIVLGTVTDVMLGVFDGEPRTLVKISVLPSLRIERSVQNMLTAFAHHLETP